MSPTCNLKIVRREIVNHHRTELRVTTCPRSRTMETVRRNGYAPAWGMLVMMMTFVWTLFRRCVSARYQGPNL